MTVQPLSICNTVAAIVSFQVGLGDCGIEPGETLAEVGADTLDCLEILMRCEEKFEVTLDDRDVTLNATIADIAGVISSKLRDKQSAMDGIERARNGGGNFK